VKKATHRLLCNDDLGTEDLLLRGLDARLRLPPTGVTLRPASTRGRRNLKSVGPCRLLFDRRGSVAV
jgi:hypothetical protein